MPRVPSSKACNVTPEWRRNDAGMVSMMMMTTMTPPLGKAWQVTPEWRRNDARMISMTTTTPPLEKARRNGAPKWPRSAAEVAVTS